MYMKKYVTIGLCLCLLLGVLSTTACGGGESNVGVVEAITLPDMTDDRQPTQDIGSFQELLDAAFEGVAVVPAEDLAYTIAEDGVTITGYHGEATKLILPDTIEGKPVTVIAEKAFSGKEKITHLSIPETVKAVGLAALEKCDKLTVLRTPVITAGEVHPYFGAIFGAASHAINASNVPRDLSTVIMTGELTAIPDYAFYGCTSLSYVDVPNSLASIGKLAFWGCDNLTWIDLSQTALTLVDTRAFTNCLSLLRFDLPATVERVGEGVLEGCGNLEGLTLPFVGGRADGKIELPEGETQDIDDKSTLTRCDYLGYIFGAQSYTFTEAFVPARLMEIKILDGCTSIPDNAFYGVSCVTNFDLPQSIQTIGRRAFYGCERMAELVLPDALTTIGEDAFRGCIRLTTVKGGEALTSIGVQAFMDCYALASAELPDSVTRIPGACFMNCISLETVTAKGVTSADKVGNYAYRHCDKLASAPFMPVETEAPAA